MILAMRPREQWDDYAQTYKPTCEGCGGNGRRRLDPRQPCEACGGYGVLHPDPMMRVHGDVPGRGR